MCGGNPHKARPTGDGEGLSPRVRGKPNVDNRQPKWTRSIPACAGETAGSGKGCANDMVYPRVCGGNLTSAPTSTPPNGLSPRVRGKPARVLTRGGAWRSIPACAGETLAILTCVAILWVYPRVCGGNLGRRRNSTLGRGLSPRVRGKHLYASIAAAWWRSIPACAGETGQAWFRICRAKVYPRVCGGNGAMYGTTWQAQGLSPRVRGKLLSIGIKTYIRRSIPACAGETAPAR